MNADVLFCLQYCKSKKRNISANIWPVLKKKSLDPFDQFKAYDRTRKLQYDTVCPI